jgi:uncharacterized UBP type Zn finger protein
MEHVEKYCRDDSEVIELLNIKDPETINFLFNSAKNALRKYPNNKKFVKRSMDIFDTFSDVKVKYRKEFCENLKGLLWVGNSCYIDSVIFALFAVPNNINSQFLQKYNVSKIQMEILNIVRYIREPSFDTKYNCLNLRKIFKQNYSPRSSDEQFFSNEMQDAGEFLLFLTDKLENTNVLQVSNTIYGFNNLRSTDHKLRLLSKQKMNDSIVWNVTPSNLEHMDINKFYNIRTFLSLKDVQTDIQDWKFENKMDTRKVIDTPYIIFNIMRKKIAGNRELYLRYKIIPTQTMMLSNERQMYLHAIVVFVSGHYITYFRCNDWYLYDDLLSGNKIVHVGTYIDMLNENPSPITDGILYFYDSV